MEEALNVYSQLATLLPDHPEVAARRDKLRAEWRTKSPEHEEAREFLTRTWPDLGTIADIKSNLPTLTTAVATCKAAGDHYTLRKLKVLFTRSAATLNQQIEKIDPATDAGRKDLMDAAEIRTVAGRVEAEVDEYLATDGKTEKK